MPIRQLDWVQALFQLGQELTLKSSDALRLKLLSHIVAGFNAQSGSIALLDEDGQQLTLVAGTGAAANYLGSKIRNGERVLGWVTKHGQAVCLNGDVANDPRFKEMQLVNNPGRPVSALCWPLLVEQRTIGAISINRAPEQPRFEEQDVTDGAVMVGLVGLVVDNMRTHDAYRQRITELNAEKEQRAAAEARLTAVLDSSDAILSVDEQGRITLFNKGAESIFGYAASEMLGASLDGLLPVRFVANHAGHMQRCAQSADLSLSMRGRNVWARRKNGGEFPAEASVIKVPDGKVTTFTVTLRDISERLDAEDKLQRLGRILDSTVNEIYVFDARTLNFNYVNQGAQRNLGYSMDELKRMTPLDLKPLYTRAAYDKLLASMDTSTEHRTVFETLHRRKNGSLYPVEVRLQHSTSETAPVYVAIIEDISERHKAQELQARLTAIIESTTDIVGTCAPDEHMLYLNAAGRRFMEFSDTELVAHLGITDLLPASALVQVRQEGIQDAIKKGFWHGETELRNRAGRIIPVSMLILAHKDGDGRLLYLSGIMRDISERKKTEDELRARQRELEAAHKDIAETQSQLLQSEKMASVGQLAAGVAHEINNPVGFVNSNLGTLQNYVGDLFKVIAAYEQLEAKLPPDNTLVQLHALKKKLDLDYLREDTGNLVKESIEGLGRVKKIVQDLKEFSHVDNAEWQLADLHHGLDSTLNIAHNELKYKTTIVKEYGTIPPVECLASQINQVFMNMLVNAAHAIETRGVITLRSGQENDHVWIEIADTGKGMSPDVQKRIFDPFFTTKPVGKGTGLGLSLAYGIVQKHHGRIEVQSEVGQGTRFRIHLPVRQPEKQAAA